MKQKRIKAFSQANWSKEHASFTHWHSHVPNMHTLACMHAHTMWSKHKKPVFGQLIWFFSLEKKLVHLHFIAVNWQTLDSQRNIPQYLITSRDDPLI